MSHGKELIGATVTDQYFSLVRYTWTGSGERFETYPEAFDAAVEFFKEANSPERVVIETRVMFRYSKDSGAIASGIETPIASESLTRFEAERRAKLRRPALA